VVVAPAAAGLVDMLRGFELDDVLVDVDVLWVVCEVGEVEGAFDCC